MDDEVALRLGQLVIASALLQLEIKQIAEFLGEPEVGKLNGELIESIGGEYKPET